MTSTLFAPNRWVCSRSVAKILKNLRVFWVWWERGRHGVIKRLTRKLILYTVYVWSTMNIKNECLFLDSRGMNAEQTNVLTDFCSVLWVIPREPKKRHSFLTKEDGRSDRTTIPKALKMYTENINLSIWKPFSLVLVKILLNFMIVTFF